MGKNCSGLKHIYVLSVASSEGELEKAHCAVLVIDKKKGEEDNIPESSE